MSLTVPADLFKKIREQAEADYPRETCGILLGPKGEPGKVTALRPCRNLQDQFHAADPVNFHRTAGTAYFMDPGDLLRIQKEAREKHCEMRVIYHSHINAGAYFSEEDQRIALSEGEPVYPGVAYLVISVVKGRTGKAALFQWDPRTKTFLEEPVS